ncbi:MULTISPECIES: hypothetical protein [Phocaeicola]|jgi:hypothetical protein|uniref:DUF4468 domain-containing protein n=1 Tax=Phocaeicola vulgatus TaxID=821 RepID=A0A415BUR7_PHOVU|nr:hypothetical protein [Phocaeicola vulgatus]RHI94839.1 hypothetical protein DW150_04405 [Phocaeicola vulgatus]
MKQRILTIILFCTFAVLAFAQNTNDTLIVKGKHYTYAVTKNGVFRPEHQNRKRLYPIPSELYMREWFKVYKSNKSISYEVQKMLQPYAKELGNIILNVQIDFKGYIYDVDYYFKNKRSPQYYLPFVEILEGVTLSLEKDIYTEVTISPEGKKHLSEFDAILLPFMGVDFNDDL